MGKCAILCVPILSVHHNFSYTNKRSLKAYDYETYRKTWTPFWCDQAHKSSFIPTQGGIKCGKGGRGFLDSKGSHQKQRPQTYDVLSRNWICRDSRAFSGVIFPPFDGSSNIFATAQSLEQIENIFFLKNRFVITNWLSFELLGYQENRLATDGMEYLSIEQNGYR